MGGRPDGLREIANELTHAADMLGGVSAALSKFAGRSKPVLHKAEGEEGGGGEPPAETGGGDFADEGTTGEEGGGDLGGGGGGEGGDLGGLFGGGGGDMGMGAGEEPPAETEGADAAGDAKLNSINTDIDGIKRTLVNMSEALKRIRDPFADPALANDAMQSL
jgi:hypothetical protein